MILYNRFLLDPLGNAPTSHLLFNQLSYIGSPYVLIGSTIKFVITPEKDVLDIEDATGAYETLVEEFLKNKKFDRSYPTAHVDTWSYPISEEKYLTNKFFKIKEIGTEELTKSPVEKPPTIKVTEYQLSDNLQIAPYSIIISETVNGVTTMAELFVKNNTMFARLIPPDLGMSTPYYFSLNLKYYKNEIIRELIEKYLDGLEVPNRVKLHETNDEWIGKRVMVDTMYARIVKLLIHKHKNVYSHGCEDVNIYFYSD